MQNIVLVNITKAFRTDYIEMQAPIALMYLSAALKKVGYNVIVEDIIDHEINQSVEKIATFNPLFVGFTTTFGVFIPCISDYSIKLKAKSPNVPIIWGGINASVAPELCLKEAYVDFVCVGEGEHTIVDFANCLINKELPETVIGIGYKKGNEIIINEARPLEKNIDLFNIDWDCVDLNKYLTTINGERVFHSYQSSRGCPYDCSFCYNSAYNKRRFRPHSIDYVMNDIDFLKSKINVNRVEFIDDHFFGNKNRALELMQRMFNNGITLTNIDVRATDINDEVMQQIIACGCNLLFFGFESENERVLEKMQKQISSHDIENAFMVASKYPINISAQIILGIPTHTKGEILNTIRYAVDKVDKYPLFSLGMVPFVPLPGTVLEREAIKYGYVPPNNILEHERFGAPMNKICSSDMSWLPWADNLDKYNILMLSTMCSYLNNSKSSPQSNLFVKAFKFPFYKLASYRLKNMNFKCIYDYLIYKTIKKIYSKIRGLY